MLKFFRFISCLTLKIFSTIELIPAHKMRQFNVGFGLSVLVVGVLVTQVGGGGGGGRDGGTDIPALNQVQMEVDKDIMKHTIEYLRNQLIACVSQSKTTHRRKVIVFSLNGTGIR